MQNRLYHSRTQSVQISGNESAMPDTISEWKDRINASPLPILQSTANYFLKRKSLAATGISILWKSLEYDPGMCLNLLRAAGHSRRIKVKTVSHAMLLLGLPNVLNRPQGLPTIESNNQAEARRLILKYFSKAYHASSYARRWSVQKKEKNLEEIHSASLSSYFMEYLLCNCRPDLMLKLETLQKQGKPWEESEKQVLGLSIKELAYEIATDWHLPELMIDALEIKDNSSDAAKYINLARQLSNESEFGWYHNGIDSVIATASEFLKRPLNSLTTQIHKEAVSAARSSCKIYSPVVPAAASLIRLPKPVTKIIKGSKHPSKKDRLKQCLYQLGHNQDLSYQQIIQHTFKGLNQGLGLKRIFFALLSGDKQQLQIKYSIAQQENNELKRLRLPLDKNSLFERLIRKPQALWVSENNREKYWLMLPKSYIDTINSDVFFAMSIFINGKPVGLFYADMEKGNLLTEIQFKYFRQLCKLSAQALEHLTNKRMHSDSGDNHIDKKVVNA